MGLPGAISPHLVTNEGNHLVQLSAFPKWHPFGILIIIKLKVDGQNRQVFRKAAPFFVTSITCSLDN